MIHFSLLSALPTAIFLFASNKPAPNTDFADLVLWQNGTVTDLGTLGGERSGATAINNNGQIVANDGYALLLTPA